MWRLGFELPRREFDYQRKAGGSMPVSQRLMRASATKSIPQRPPIKRPPARVVFLLVCVAVGI